MKNLFKIHPHLFLLTLKYQARPNSFFITLVFCICIQITLSLTIFILAYKGEVKRYNLHGH